MGKKRCKDCEREKLRRAEERQMKLWLCFFYEDVFCPYSEGPLEKRPSSVCLDCDHYARFQREMAEEDKQVMDEIDDIRRNPEKYGYSGGIS